MCTIAKVFREPVNTITHVAGALGSVAALTLMVVYAAIRSDAWHVVSFAIFGSTMLMMYTSSSLYHALKISDKGLQILRRVDHIMIFMLIAGSYTPLCLVPLRGVWGWSLFGSVWGIAFIGIFLKLFCLNVPRWVSTFIYLVMGWLCIVAVYPLVNILEAKCLLWLALGGLSYTIGAIIYATKKPDPLPGVFGFHEIWHLFVLAGSFCHFWAVFRYIMYM